MKIILLLVTLMFPSRSIFAASSSQPKISSTSWSLLYGYSKFANDANYKPGGSSYKFQLGTRWETNVESSFFVRYASQKQDITASSIEGSLERATITYGFNIGYWLFSFFKLNAGYAFHGISEKINGSYSSSQLATIKSDYGMTDIGRKGLFAGADLVLIQGKSLQLFTNYEYYHLNHANAHDWDAMVGLRFYPGGSSSGSGGSSKNMFSKLFDWIFDKAGQ